MNTVPPGQEVILAEQAFLTLAREWQDIAAKTGPDCALPWQADTTALACLLLAVEWGEQFTEAVNPLIEENKGMAFSRWSSVPPIQELETLVWRLCRSDTAGAPSRTVSMDDLLGTLNHHNSDIRTWVMKLGWMIRPWLPAGEAVPLLLQNVADTLGGVRLAMGLARGLCATDEELKQFIAGYEPPEFADQYADRITRFREEGFALSQREFWNYESRCRRMIEQAVLGMTYKRSDPVAREGQQKSPDPEE
jgi:hypothetical protein